MVPGCPELTQALVCSPGQLKMFEKEVTGQDEDHFITVDAVGCFEDDEDEEDDDNEEEEEEEEIEVEEELCKQVLGGRRELGGGVEAGPRAQEGPRPAPQGPGGTSAGSH